MGQSHERPKHPLEKLMDNPWLLLVLGVVVPFLSYTVWGWIEIANVQQGPWP